MSVKKRIICSIAGLAALGATAAYAGGPDTACVPPAYQQNIYLEGNVGYVFQNWSRFTSNPIGTGVKGGFTGFGDIGYQWARNFAVEFGGGYLPRVVGSAATVSAHFFIYGALRLTAPIWQKLDVFAKAGAVWHTWDDSSVSGRRGYVDALFAAGLLYPIRNNFNANLQFTLIPGRGRSNTATHDAPTSYLLTAGLGYHFAV